ncbi:MAG: cellulose synthase operon protein YhjQ/BcsQ [Sphingomonadaceae bacterium]
MALLQPLAPADVFVGEPLRILAFATDASSRHCLRKVLTMRGWRHAEVREGGVDAAHSSLASEVAAPDVLVIDLDACATPLPAVDALADVCPGNLKVLAIGTENDVGLFRALRGLGVMDYLPKPLDQHDLASALAAAVSQRDCPPDKPRFSPRRGEVIAFLGARGGAGVTAVALAMAHRLASTRRTVFFDLDLQAGTAMLDLDAEVSPGLAELMLSPDRVDQAVLEAALRPHPLGFSLLTAEEPLDRPLVIKPEGVQALLSALASHADCVVVDMPRRLDDAGRALLRLADRAVIVAPQTLPGVRETQRLASLITGLRAGQRPVLIANRTGETDGEVAAADFERTAGGSLAARIPYVPKIAGTAAVQATALSAIGVKSPLLRELDLAIRALELSAVPVAGPDAAAVNRHRSLLRWIKL